MDTARQIQTASVATIVLGIWVALSPLYITVEGGALISMIVVGALLAVLGLTQLFVRSTLPSMLGVILGLWLIVSSIVFSVSSAAMINMVVTGLVTFVATLWDGVEVNANHDRMILNR